VLKIIEVYKMRGRESIKKSCSSDTGHPTSDTRHETSAFRD